jgi:hypothetical protein
LASGSRRLWQQSDLPSENSVYEAAQTGARRAHDRTQEGRRRGRRKKNPLPAACATEVDGLLGRLIGLVPSS